MELIQTTTVDAGGASSITFSSIPQTYTDLVLVLSGRTNWGSTIDSFALLINSVSSAGRRLEGTGSSSTSASSASFQMLGYLDGSGATSNVFSSAVIHIPNYTRAAAKAWFSDSVTENNSTASYSTLVSGYCTDTSAVTTLSISNGSGSMVQYTTASLYGILKGSGGATVS